jgi:spore coat protein A
MGMFLNNTPWQMPVAEKPVINTTEVWELVLDRCCFDVFLYQDKGELRYTAPAIPASPEESGWKHTIRCETDQVTRIIVPFEGYTGRYVWHCHLLEHEDNEMMRPFEVIEAHG